MRQLLGLTAIVAVLGLIVSTNVAFSQQPPSPTTVYESRFEVAAAPEPIEVIQRVVDFPPGAWTPPHVHGGHAFVTLLEGEIVVRQIDGTETSFTAGEAWAEDPSQVHATGNVGAQTSRILATILLPKGAPVTTVVEQTAPAQPAPTAPLPASAPAPVQIPRSG